MGILTRQEKQYVEHHMRRREIYETLIADYYACVGIGGISERVGGSTNMPGNPTEREAIAAMEPPQEIVEAQRWLQVHKMAWDRLDDEKQAYMNQVWYLSASPEQVMTSLSIEATTFFRWKDEIIAVFAMCAAIKGMLRYESKTSGVFATKSMI